MNINIQDQIVACEAPVTVYDAAKELGPVPRSVLGAEINGKTVALTQELTEDCEVKLLYSLMRTQLI